MDFVTGVVTLPYFEESIEISFVPSQVDCVMYIAVVSAILSTIV